MTETNETDRQEWGAGTAVLLDVVAGQELGTVRDREVDPTSHVRPFGLARFDTGRRVGRRRRVDQEPVHRLVMALPRARRGVAGEGHSALNSNPRA